MEPRTDVTETRALDKVIRIDEAQGIKTSDPNGSLVCASAPSLAVNDAPDFDVDQPW
jgi:hypothetical protein